MRRIALIGAVALSAVAAPAQARTPTLTFKQSRAVLAGLARADAATAFTVRDCTRRSRARIDCTVDEYGVPTAWTDEPMEVTDAHYSVARRGLWGVVSSRDPGWITEYRSRLH